MEDIEKMIKESEIENRMTIRMRQGMVQNDNDFASELPIIEFNQTNGMPCHKNVGLGKKRFMRQRLDDVAIYVGVLLIFGFVLNGVITLIKYIWD